MANNKARVRLKVGNRQYFDVFIIERLGSDWFLLCNHMGTDEGRCLKITNSSVSHAKCKYASIQRKGKNILGRTSSELYSYLMGIVYYVEAIIPLQHKL